MCNDMNCGVKKRTLTLGTTAEAQTADFGTGVFLWEVKLPALGNGANLDVTIPGQANLSVLDLDASSNEAATAQALLPVRNGNNRDGGAAISGTTVPFYSHDGRFTVTTSGTITGGGDVVFLASQSPPPVF